MASECVEVGQFPVGVLDTESKGEPKRRVLHLPASLKPTPSKSIWQKNLGTAIFLSEIERRYNPA